MNATIVIFVVFCLTFAKSDFEHVFVPKTICFVGVILKSEHSAAEGSESDHKNHENDTFSTP